MSTKQQIDNSGLKVTVIPVPGSHEQHFGQPVRTPNSVEISVSGTVRVPVNYDRTECAGCSNWDGFRCLDGFDKEGIEESLMETLATELPFRVLAPEAQPHLFIT